MLAQERTKIVVMLIFIIAVFSGPFAGNMILPLFKHISSDFNVGMLYVNLSITFYMVPFGAIQLFSGLLSDLFYGRRKILLIGAIMYSLGALLAYLSPDITIFLFSRALQGVGSAFVTPISMALIGDIFEASKRGKIMGVGALLTTLGTTLGPLVGGFLGLLCWRYAFLVILSLSLTLLFTTFFLKLEEKESRRFDRKYAFETLKRGLFDPSLVILGMIGMSLFFTRMSIYTFLSNIVLYPPYNLTSDVWGFYLFIAGLGGICASLVGGYLTDKLGRKRVVIVGVLSLTVIISMYMFIDWFTYLPLLLFAMGSSITFTFIPLNTLAIEINPELRATATSIYGFFRFVGYALGPVAPYYLFILFGLNGVVSLDLLLVSLCIVTFLLFFKKQS
ncbi:MAG: MFS transporter [Candidatus Baldrarchaeia archaeon]